jgi:hypothetical protein
MSAPVRVATKKRPAGLEPTGALWPMCAPDVLTCLDMWARGRRDNLMAPTSLPLIEVRIPMRMLPWLIAGLIGSGCAASPSHSPVGREVAHGPRPSASLLVIKGLVDADVPSAVFLLAELLDPGVAGWSQEVLLDASFAVSFIEWEETDHEAVEPAMARRPPRGSGPLVRRPQGHRLGDTRPPGRWEVYQPPPAGWLTPFSRPSHSTTANWQKPRRATPSTKATITTMAFPSTWEGDGRDDIPDTGGLSRGHHPGLSQGVEVRHRPTAQPSRAVGYPGEGLLRYPLPQLIGVTP